MSEKIAVIFDFDDTLAPDSTSGVLESVGVDAPSFWKDTVQPLLAEGWDPIPAYLYQMIVTSNDRPAGDRITQQRLGAYGESISVFPGVMEIFDTLITRARGIDPSIDVEFYLISSGIGEVLRASCVAPRFRDIFASDFVYNEAGEILFPKNIVSFTDKTRFLYQISKGLIGPEARSKPFEVNRRMPSENYRIPFRHMIVVGDGMTDVPCFSLIKRYEGVAIGVYDADQPDKWGRSYTLATDRRVMGLYQANYQKGGDLHNNLLMAVGEIAGHIAEQRGV